MESLSETSQADMLHESQHDLALYGNRDSFSFPATSVTLQLTLSARHVDMDSLDLTILLQTSLT